MLYEDGVNYLYGSNNNLIDSINICNILKPLNLLRNIHEDEENQKISARRINKGVLFAILFRLHYLLRRFCLKITKCLSINTLNRGFYRLSAM